MTGRILVLAVLLALASPALAAPQVYVNNRPFKGAVAGAGTGVLLEAGPLFEMLDLSWVVDGRTAVAGGLSVPLQESGGVPMVSALEVARATGGRVLENPALGSVDLYAHDVASAGRAAWERVFYEEAVASQFDLQVLAWTSRTILKDDLEMRLDQEVSLVLASEAEMSRVGLAGLGGARFDGSRVTFYFKEGSAPLSVLSTLAFNWGVVWAREAGAPDMQAQGLGLWASYNVLRRLGVAADRRTYGEWQGQGPQAVFQNLCGLQDQGGPAAVLEVVRRSGGKT